MHLAVLNQLINLRVVSTPIEVKLHNIPCRERETILSGLDIQLVAPTMESQSELSQSLEGSQLPQIFKHTRKALIV